VILATVLMAVAPRVQDRLEFDIDWASNMVWTTVLAF
jgi:hypothetical protein